MLQKLMMAKVENMTSETDTCMIVFDFILTITKELMVIWKARLCLHVKKEECMQ